MIRLLVAGSSATALAERPSSSAFIDYHDRRDRRLVVGSTMIGRIVVCVVFVACSATASAERSLYRATASADRPLYRATVLAEHPASSPLIDNDRVAVWDVTAADPNGPRPRGDSVWISLVDLGKAVVKPKGTTADVSGLGGRAIVIDLKDARAQPIENKSGYPLAFPRPGVKKLLENDRVIVWDYAWTSGVPTPMHFHDKDVVVTYVETGALKSTTADGQASANEFKFGDVRFNQRNRVHTELLVSGKARAIITELK
jgi:hypothetical protein